MSLGALPARFRRRRVLVLGCGDIGLRTLAALTRTAQVTVLTQARDRLADLRARGVRPLLGDLDDAASLQRLAGLATELMYLAPPPSADPGACSDARVRNVVAALRRRSPVTSCVYVSTTGVYGDCAGAWVDERQVPRPQTTRARRRVDAEQRLRAWNAATVILRAPGIYALDRPTGHPARRLQAQTPVPKAQDDVYTNHIHADDLARACVLARRQRARGLNFNVSDDTQMSLAQYWIFAADLLGFPRPRSISRAQAQEQLSAEVLSFWGESRRLRNQRMKSLLGLSLRHPTVASGLGAPQAGGGIVPAQMG